MNRRFFLLGCLVGWTAATAAALADPAAMIAKARAYLGSSEALAAVHSIHYNGKLDTIEEIEGVEKPVSYDIDIIFQKPYQQRIVLTKEKLVETTALDDYEAWHRQQDKNDEARWRTLLFPKTKVKQLRASSWENLAFFSGLEQIGGTVVDRNSLQPLLRSGLRSAPPHRDRPRGEDPRGRRNCLRRNTFPQAYRKRNYAARCEGESGDDQR
jgi:hypothetical protein